MARRTPIYTLPEWRRPFPEDRSEVIAVFEELRNDYRAYVKESAEEENMLLKALRDQEAEYTEKLEELTRKIADMTEGHKCVVTNMQQSLNKAHVLSRELAEMTKKYEEAQAMVEWQARNEIDSMDLVDHLSKKNRKLKKRLKAIREMTKC